MSQSQRAVSSHKKALSLAEYKTSIQNKEIDRQVKKVLSKCVVDRQTWVADNAVKILQKQRRVREQYFPYIINPYTFTPNAKLKPPKKKTQIKQYENIFQLTQNEDLILQTCKKKLKKRSRSKKSRGFKSDIQGMDHIDQSRLKGFTNEIIKSAYTNDSQPLQSSNVEFQDQSDEINENGYFTERIYPSNQTNL